MIPKLGYRCPTTESGAFASSTAERTRRSSGCGAHPANIAGCQVRTCKVLPARFIDIGRAHVESPKVARAALRSRDFSSSPMGKKGWPHKAYSQRKWKFITDPKQPIDTTPCRTHDPCKVECKMSKDCPFRVSHTVTSLPTLFRTP